MKMPRLLLPVFLAAAMGMLTACGPSNTIHLQPYKAASSVLPGPTAPTISVVKFQDQRPDPSSLGKRRDGSYFTTMDSASEWFSRSIVDALSARGYQVSYAQSTAEAIKGKPAYLLTSEVEALAILSNLQILYLRNTGSCSSYTLDTFDINNSGICGLLITSLKNYTGNILRLISILLVFNIPIAFHFFI